VVVVSKYKVVNISMPEEFFQQVEELAKEENRTRSELYREALRQYIETRRWQKLQKETAKRAQEMGITSEEDVERIVAEIRKKESA
jgi:CopG family transcriptional regulator/antitoxin EndoAI